MTYEYCCKCDCKTGRAGAGDDSLYTEHDGPFCENCFLKQEAQPAHVQPVAWLYPEGLEALKAGKCWTAYGTKQDDNCNIPVHLNAAVAPKVEPVKTECDGFDSHPAAPVQPAETSAERTLQHLGYTDNGGEFWKPPLGKPAPVQEPVGYVAENGVVDWNVCAPPILTDLYTTPPAAPALQAELEATNRQVEILSDALAESRREVAALKAVQPAVPDAMTSADIQEHIEDVAGWNECRQAMLEMMK